MLANCGGLKIDGETLYEENGVLKAQSGGGGGVVVTFNINESTGAITATKTPTEVKTILLTSSVMGIIHWGGITLTGTMNIGLYGEDTPIVIWSSPLQSGSVSNVLIESPTTGEWMINAL